MSRLHISRTALTIALIAASSTAFASGFQLKEQSAASQGTSFAGATANTDDISAIFYNPAAMTAMGGSAAGANLSVIDPYAQMDLRRATGVFGQPNAGNSHGGNAGGPVAVPAIYAMTTLPDDWKLGLSINTPFGLQTSYNAGWVGRYYAIDSQLQTTNFTPSLAHKVTKDISLAAGIQVQQAYARLTNAVNVTALTSNAFGAQPDGRAKVTGDDIGVGYVLGAMYQPTKDTDLGLSYRSRVHHELDGDIRFSGLGIATGASPAVANSAVKAKLVTPDVLSIGLKQKLTDRWDLLADASWTNWSLFNNLTVKNKSNGAVRQSVDESWHDTYFVGLGGEYKATERLKLRTGVAYDQSPVGDNHRTFRVPDSNRYWLSGGAGYEVMKNLNVDLAYTHIFGQTVSVLEDASVATGAGIVQGNFHPHVDIVSAEVSYKF